MEEHRLHVTGYHSRDFQFIRKSLTGHIQAYGMMVNTGQWQSQSDVPMTQTVELEYVHIEYLMPSLMDLLQEDVKPNLPWAEDHFQERVSGIPHNPPPSAAYWPYAVRNHEGHTIQGKFSHTYPERLWGIQYALSDLWTRKAADEGEELATLNDLVALLIAEPYTRQAFIPIWWPIDGKMAGKERVPCTLGYHFMMRDGMLNCMYPMRSCDLLRHFTDDIYMACRLTQWIVDKLNSSRVGYENQNGWISPGTLYMDIASLHVFETDLNLLRLQSRQERYESATRSTAKDNQETGDET